MIPVTSFAGKKVAVFGLGGSGLVSASALLAGGADVVGWDDSADTVAKATSAGIPTADLRHIDWSKIAALVLAPGVPLTHPAPHWTVGLARAAAVEVIGDIELFCRERRRHAPNAPFVAITGTNGKSTTTALIAHLVGSAGYDAQLGGNIGTAILSLEPPGRGRVHVIEVSSYQIDLAPSLDPSVGILINVSEDHLDRHGTLAHYAAVKERLVAGVQENGTAIVGVDDNWCQAAADRIEQAGKRVVRVSVRRPLADGIYCRSRAHHAGRGRQRAPRSRCSAGSDRCAACTMRRTPPARAAAALALGLSIAQIQKGLRSFPGLAHRMEEVGRKGRVLFVNDSKATNADSSAQALACFSDIFWIAGRQAEDRRALDAHRLLPAHPQGLSDRRGGGGICRRARRARCRTWSPARSTARSRSPPATPRRPMSPSRWCCSRRPAPRSTSTAISRCAATPSGNWCWRCRGWYRSINSRLPSLKKFSPGLKNPWHEGPWPTSSSPTKRKTRAA